VSSDAGDGSEDDENGVVLVIDQPDLLLAATGPAQGIGATEMGEWIMGLEHVGQSGSPT
jgi:elongator complex protein 6